MRERERERERKIDHGIIKAVKTSFEIFYDFISKSADVHLKSSDRRMKYFS